MSFAFSRGVVAPFVSWAANCAGTPVTATSRSASRNRAHSTRAALGSDPHILESIRVGQRYPDPHTLARVDIFHSERIVEVEVTLPLGGSRLAKSRQRRQDKEQGKQRPTQHDASFQAFNHSMK